MDVSKLIVDHLMEEIQTLPKEETVQKNQFTYPNKFVKLMISLSAFLNKIATPKKEDPIITAGIRG